MRCSLVLAVVATAAIFACFDGAAAQLDVSCDAFVKNADGSWSALRSVQIHGAGEGLTIREGSVLRPGAVFRGIDLGSALDERCPVSPEPAPTAATPLPPRVALGTYADSNGNIDAQRLTCGDIVDVSPDQAERLLVWYSGWYRGSARKRGFNLTHVGTAINAVLDFCKSNRDKKLVQVMELMLK